MNEKNELETNSTSSEPQVPDIRIPAIRTLKDDVSQTVKKDRITTAKILMAEQHKQQVAEKKESQETVKKTGNAFAVLFGLVFIALSIGIVGYFGYSRVTTPEPVFVNTQDNYFLFVFDQEKLIDSDQPIDEINKLMSQYQIESSQFAPESFTEIVFFKEENESTPRLTTLEFFRLFKIPVLTNIIRSVSSEFSYGFYTIEGRAEPFLVVGVVDYENAYANMFTWESTLALDIKSVFPVLRDLFDISKIKGMTNQEEVVQTEEPVQTESVSETPVTPPATEVSTTETPPPTAPVEEVTSESINRSIRFTDLVLSNYNTRAVRNENGSPFFYYAFIGKDKILFAQNPKLIAEIVKKIKQKQLVR